MTERGLVEPEVAAAQGEGLGDPESGTEHDPEGHADGEAGSGRDEGLGFLGGEIIGKFLRSSRQAYHRIRGKCKVTSLSLPHWKGLFKAVGRRRRRGYFPKSRIRETPKSTWEVRVFRTVGRGGIHRCLQCTIVYLSCIVRARICWSPGRVTFEESTGRLVIHTLSSCGRPDYMIY